MVFASWRGVVGCVKPTHRPGSLEEFIRLLPEGIGVVPVYLNFQRGTEDEFRAALNAVHEKVAELATEGVDLIHPEGAPPFMVHGYKGEATIINVLADRIGPEGVRLRFTTDGKTWDIRLFECVGPYQFQTVLQANSSQQSVLKLLG